MILTLIFEVKGHFQGIFGQRRFLSTNLLLCCYVINKGVANESDATVIANETSA